jgi:hypothetical protein
MVLMNQNDTTGRPKSILQRHHNFTILLQCHLHSFPIVY